MLHAFVAVFAMAILSVLLALLLVWANKRLHVQEDPRIDEVESLLPRNNCGACGFPGCRAFAEALVQNKAQPVQCTVSANDGRVRIATYLGVDVGVEEKRVARLACAGGANVARMRASYTGLPSCRAAALVGGGGKACSYGCLGYGDCASACTFDAIHMNAQRLPVVDEDSCTACGDCVTACPKDLFSLHAVSHRLWVACCNPGRGDALLAACEVACTACGKCAFDAPAFVRMGQGLPLVDYSKAVRVPEEAQRRAIERCPTGAIVWLAADGRIIKGVEAATVIRKEPLAPAPS